MNYGDTPTPLPPDILSISLPRKQSVAKVLAARLREKILSGELPPGTRLPTTAQLATQWNTYVSAVHTALATLTREGLLVRKNRKGTFVRFPDDRLSRIGILAPNQLWESTSEFLFIREVFLLLEKHLTERNIQTTIWFETRKGNRSNTPLASLARSVQREEVQAIIALSAGEYNAGWLNELPVPVTGFSQCLNHRAVFSNQQFFRLALAHLKENGCRSALLLSALHDEGHIRLFEKMAAEAGIATPQQSMFAPWRHPQPMDEYGYNAILKLRECGERPDGLIVYPDGIARGAMLGISMSEWRIPDEINVIFHRNAEVPFLCPLPVTYIENSCQSCVETFFRQVGSLFLGDATQSCVEIPYRLVRPSP